MMHQQPPSQQYNMPQAGGQHYQGQQPPMGMMGQVNQGNHMMGQRQIPPYRPPQQGRNSLRYFYIDFKQPCLKPFYITFLLTPNFFQVIWCDRLHLHTLSVTLFKGGSCSKRLLLSPWSVKTSLFSFSFGSFWDYAFWNYASQICWCRMLFWNLSDRYGKGTKYLLGSEFNYKKRNYVPRYWFSFFLFSPFQQGIILFLMP